MITRVSVYGGLIVVLLSLWSITCFVFMSSFFQGNPPQVVQDKILSLIQDWADAFRGSPELSYVLETYEALRAQGLKVLLYSMLFLVRLTSYSCSMKTMAI